MSRWLELVVLHRGLGFFGCTAQHSFVLRCVIGIGAMSETNTVASLVKRVESDGPIFEVSNGLLGVFCPATVTDIEAANSKNATLPHRLSDFLPGQRHQEPPLWTDIRQALQIRSRQQNCRKFLEPLHRRMRASLDLATNANADQDLTMLVGKMISESLIPLVVDGMGRKCAQAVERDRIHKVETMISNAHATSGLSDKLKEALIQISAGRAIKAHMVKLRNGSVRQRDDFARAVLDFDENLTADRAAYLVTTILTAIVGAPGTVAAGALFELIRHPHWADMIAEEFRSLSEDELYDDLPRSVPIAHQFAREVLRLWSFPLITVRRASCPIEVRDFSVAEDGHYCLSSYVTHHNRQFWDNAEHFDPERWSSRKTVKENGAYVPFGWAPRTCPGAALGLSQLLLFMQLMTVEYAVRLKDPHKLQKKLDGLALPQGLFGQVVRR